MLPGGVGGVTGQMEVLRRVTPEPRLTRAAHEFEAQMMKELLEPLTRPTAWDEGQGNESGILGNLASESLAGGLSARGGMGIADQIVGALSHSGNHSPNLPVVKNSQTSTGMSSHK